MNLSSFLNSRLLILAPILILVSCSSGEIRRLQESVNDLEKRLYRYQQNISQESELTTSSLSDVNKAVNDAFREIRYSQSNLETMLEQLSTRVSKAELQLTEIQENVTRLNNLSSDNYNVLNENLTKTRLESQQTVESKIRDLQTEIERDLTSLRRTAQANQTAIANSQSNLNQRITTLETETDKIFRTILKDLGITPPPKTSTSADADEVHDSGRIHLVVKGDNLSSIAAKYNVSAKAIQTLNGIEDPSLIILGQRLKIPDK